MASEKSKNIKPDRQSEAELERAAKALTEAGIENTGVKNDKLPGKRYVAFKDPDRISRELYMA